MIFTLESLEPQLKLLMHEYPGLSVIEICENQVILRGNILVFREHNEFVLKKNYAIEICIPLKSDKLPFVIDFGKQIEKEYQHYYPDCKLCLETDSCIRIRFIDGFDLVVWMAEYVEIYYFSYEYYKRFGVFPFGERKHGFLGIIQTYKDLFNAKDEAEAHTLMLFIINNSYRGHHPCPCSSGEKIRNCHGIHMLPFYRDMRKRQILHNDINCISKELTELHGRKR